jgi:metal-dependent hydrolase (beta-lactamase superfamily II)
METKLHAGPIINQERRGEDTYPPNNKNHAVIGGLHNCNAMQRNNPHADAQKKTSVRTIGAARRGAAINKFGWQ